MQKRLVSSYFFFSKRIKKLIRLYIVSKIINASPKPMSLERDSIQTIRVRVAYEIVHKLDS